MASDGIDGIWRPAGTARALPCRMEIDDEARAVSPDGLVLARAPLASAEISSRIGSVARRIAFPDGSEFETADNDGVDRLLKAAGVHRTGFVSGLEAFRPRLMLFVALTVVFCVAIYRYAVPALVEVAVLATPPAFTKVLSQSVFLSLDKSVLGESSLPQTRRDALARQFGQLAALTPRGARGTDDEPAYTLNFRDGGAIGPNAFALPDGTIILTDQLVEMAGEDDEMVMGVLAHEIGHVDHEHSLRQLYRAAGTAGLIMLIGGDIGSATEDILTQGAGLMALSHSRTAERDADHYSVELMHKAGKDPTAVARFFELLRSRFGDSGGNDFFSTHPSTPERITETRRYAEEVKKAD